MFARKRHLIYRRLLWTALLLVVIFYAPGQAHLGSVPFHLSLDLPAQGANKKAGQLNAGFPVSRPLNGGQTHSLNFSVVAGQYASLRVVHRGITLSAALLDKSGREIVEIEDSGVSGQIFLSMIADDTGDYTLRMRSTE